MEAPKTSFHPEVMNFENLPDLEKADLPLPPQLNATPVHTDIQQFFQSANGARGTKTPESLARSQQVTPPNSPKTQDCTRTAKRSLFGNLSESLPKRVSAFCTLQHWFVSSIQVKTEKNDTRIAKPKLFNSA